MEEKHNFRTLCFVCGKPLDKDKTLINTKTNLPVCENCISTQAEKKAEKNALDSLADGFVCGCI